MLCKAGHAPALQLRPQTLLGMGKAPGLDLAAGRVYLVWGVSLLRHPALCLGAAGLSWVPLGCVAEHADEKAVKGAGGFDPGGGREPGGKEKASPIPSPASGGA